MTDTTVKFKSLILLSLLLLGLPVVAVIPNTVHAATPTITLSSTSGTGNINVGVEVDGSGFPGVTGVGITLYFKDATQSISASGATKAALYGQSLWTSGTTTTGNVAVDANGNFRAFFDVPALAYLVGGYNVFAAYTPTGGSQSYTSAVKFMISPYLDVRLASDAGTAAVTPTTRSGHFGQWFRIRVYGFGASETVTISGFPTSLSTTTISTGTTGQYSAQVFIRMDGEALGGAKTFTGTGASSGATATRSFTINPTIVLYYSQASTTTATTISIPSTAPATVYFELHGFANAETISAATVGGQAGTISSGTTTTSTSGAAGLGAGNHLAVLYTTSIPFGTTSMTVTGSTTGTVTFSSANGNVFDPFAATGTTSPSGGTFNILKPAIIASNSQTSTSATAIQILSASSGSYGDTLRVYYTGLKQLDTPSSVTFDSTAQTTTCAASPYNVADGNGVVVCSISVPDGAKGAHTLATSGATFTPTMANAVFTENPILFFNSYDAADDATGVNQFTGSAAVNTGGYFNVVGHGFKASEALGLTIGSTVISASYVTPGTTGAFAATTLTSLSLNFPDLASGSYSVVASGSTSGNTATGLDYYFYNTLSTSVSTLTVAPNLQLSSALSISPGTAVNAGQTIVLLSSSTNGIHGLAANTAYQVRLDSASGTWLSNFTSTSTGGVPAGTQFKVPAASSGNHIVDLSTGGTSAVFGQTYLGQTYAALEGDESTYGQLYLNIQGSITVTPSAGNVGATVTITGSGVKASTSYAVQIGSPAITYATFTSSASGAIPTGVSFPFPALATTTESGTSVTLNLLNTGASTTDATGTFLEQAAIGLNMTSAPAGHAVALTGSGLVNAQGYNIIWNAGYTANGASTGTVVGAFTARSDGSASATFTVPASASAGSYTVQLYRTGDSIGSTTVPFRLVSGATISVTTAPSGTVNTSTFTTSTAPSKTVVNGQATISGSFSNSYSGSLSVYMWVSVMNSAGQTVGVYIGSATVASGATATIGAALFNLPSGTYTASVFLTTTSGIVVSTTSTVSSFSV